ncbi:hypothetical protein HYALB_00004425 [Hymenoscyphus albidus]|uniref:Major facilitator superfamily (MFS) profile domain-containing protein n=1 Tax=Hymenoscyphus albidus TaxID=595503 RepID=A0A9N9LPB4_9HELO|nr:hypothetical protein HYALB_00004425 [Hymenoscyphus albidus]
MNSNLSETSSTPTSSVAEFTKKPVRGWRFWAMFPGLCLTSFICALNSTILSTVLPVIAADLHSSSLYVWTVNAYTLTFTAVQPLYGQSADVFGRKKTILTAMILFMIGSTICGGAQNTAMLIGGRVIQGLGGGGLSILPAMVVCDLAPLRERQKYTGVVYASYALGTFLGPLCGGIIVDHTGWRWVFWLNLLVAALALTLIITFVKLEVSESPIATTGFKTAWRQLAGIDYIGNFLLMSAVTSILIALAGTGSKDASISWNSWNTLVPLLLGLIALPLFVLYEASPFCSNPMTPLRLFSNMTSGLSFFLAFLHGLILYWATYFLPVYFQGVLLNSPQESGINILAGALPMVPFGIAGGFVISKTGRYRLNQLIGFALAATAIGLFCVLDQHSSALGWVPLQILFAAGAGIVQTSTLPAIQAPLPESDVAMATATWGFVHGLGFVCGVAIPSSVFETKAQSLLHTISDVAVREAFQQAGAYEHASRAYITTLRGPIRVQVIELFRNCLKLLWGVGTAFAVSGVIASFFVKDVVLRESLDTKYGFKNEKVHASDESLPTAERVNQS